MIYYILALSTYLTKINTFTLKPEGNRPEEFSAYQSLYLYAPGEVYHKICLVLKPPNTHLQYLLDTMQYGRHDL